MCDQVRDSDKTGKKCACDEMFCLHLLRSAWCALVPRFLFFRKFDLHFGGSASWNTQPKCFAFFNKATDPFHNFSSIFSGLTVNLSVLEHALIAESASRFSFVILTYGKMPIITQRICALSFDIILAWFLIFPS